MRQYSAYFTITLAMHVSHAPQNSAYTNRATVTWVRADVEKKLHCSKNNVYLCQPLRMAVASDMCTMYTRMSTCVCVLTAAAN